MTKRDGAVTVPARLAERVAERPDDVAHVVVDVGELTFRGWQARSSAVARGLVARGVRPGDRVALRCRRPEWLEYAIGYVAIAMAGGVAVQVAWERGEEDLRTAIELTEAVGVVGDPGRVAVAQWAASVASLEEGQSSEPLDLELDPDEDVEVLMTSATTGKPKAVAFNHRGVLAAHSARPGPLRVVLGALLPGTVGGRGVMAQPLDGAPHQVVTLPVYSDAGFVDAVERHGVTDVVLVPALVFSLLNRVAVDIEVGERLNAAPVRMVRTTSAPIPPVALEELQDLFPQAAIINYFGSTESLPAGLRLRYGSGRPGSVGRAEGWSEVRVVGDEGEPVPTDTTGHVQLRRVGAPVARYLNAGAEATAVFRGDGWVQTGDLGWLDQDGYLFLVDREGDVVNSGGHKVSTIAVEAAIAEFPGVIEAAAVGLPHRMLGQVVVAAVRARAGVSAADLNVFLVERLGLSRAPRRFFFRDEFPRTANDKVAKRRLREELAAELARAGETLDDPELGSDLHERVREIWAAALGVREVPWDADFVAYGGTSLTATEVVRKVARELGRSVRERDVYEAPTVGEFARRVEAARRLEPGQHARIERVPREAG